MRSKHSPIEGTEWEDVLSSVLLTQQYEEKRSKPDSVEKLELTSLVADDQLTVIVRRNISGITQRLGEITLRILDEEEAADRVELLDWVAVAVDRATLLENEVKNLNVKYEEQGRTIDRLNKQLEELIVAKNEHEASLLQNSQELLNAKKLKIRDQQRLLAGAKVDPQTGKCKVVAYLHRRVGLGLRIWSLGNEDADLEFVGSRANTNPPRVGDTKAPR